MEIIIFFALLYFVIGVNYASIEVAMQSKEFKEHKYKKIVKILFFLFMCITWLGNIIAYDLQKTKL